MHVKGGDELLVVVKGGPHPDHAEAQELRQGPQRLGKGSLSFRLSEARAGLLVERTASATF
jgi:hypothetical protein